MVETRLQTKRNSPSDSETPANKRQKKNEGVTPPTTPAQSYDGNKKKKTTIKVIGKHPSKKKLHPGSAPLRSGPVPPEICLKRARKWEIFLGREIKDDVTGKGVTDEAMDDYLANEVTGRFPLGSTYCKATGQWARPLSNGGEIDIVKEGTLVVFLMAFEGDDLNAVAEFRRKVFEAAAAYRDRFRQDAVLVCESENMMALI
ncbi:hypothetical protein DL546_000265 [Coniochaeta pulveracea]|uniref:Uncharacterized protein n=1 Tax=Coniochaeta pulveracea TaxID=177199 RepID=A0A420XVY0_9PEZI|nr:hypothetical protein DL546_000265 [Coniochaeta pulveracea]